MKRKNQNIAEAVTKEDEQTRRKIYSSIIHKKSNTTYHIYIYESSNCDCYTITLVVKYKL